MIDSYFYLAASTQHTSAFFLTSKTSVNIRSYFIALVFLTIMGDPGDIGLLYVDVSEVEIIDS